MLNFFPSSVSWLFFCFSLRVDLRMDPYLIVTLSWSIHSPPTWTSVLWSLLSLWLLWRRRPKTGVIVFSSNLPIYWPIRKARMAAFRILFHQITFLLGEEGRCALPAICSTGRPIQPCTWLPISTCGPCVLPHTSVDSIPLHQQPSHLPNSYTTLTIN